MQQPNEFQIQTTLQNSTGIECQSCQGVFFKPTTILRKISKLYAGTPNDVIIPVQAFRCDDCGEVLKEFFPEGMTDLEQRFNLKKQTSLTIE